ncbi:FCHO1 protein, partial [Tachuris rubrigastra]|nr:FCHO1 protein [Tachuris rubrigastra]
ERGWGVPWQGEKNHGFDVLYHNMKHGQISTKELADFVRERYRGGGVTWGGPQNHRLHPQSPLPTVPRAAIEENYAKAMVKLSKMATNGTQLGTFAPLWEVFRISSDKLALCHLELMKKLHDLIKEISRYGEEQGRVHKKVPSVSPSSPPPRHPRAPCPPSRAPPQSKEEVSGTLEAVQLLHGVAQLLPKSKESYHSKCQEYERLRKEGTSQKEIDKAELKSRKAGEALRRAVDKYNAARADFEQRMLDSAMRFQEVEEAHLRHMKGLIGSYSHSVEDTHVQIGQVHEEFKQNVENIGTDMLLRRFAESKGTGRERPGETGGIPPFPGWILDPGLIPDPRQERWISTSTGWHQRRKASTSASNWEFWGAENPGCSSSDSDYDEDEPRKFYVHIKPVQPREGPGNAEASVEQLKATVGNLILPPGIGVSLGGADRGYLVCPPRPLQGSDRGSPAAPRAYVLTSSSSPFSSSSPENVEDSGLDSPSHPAPGPSPDSRPWTPQPGTPQSPLPKQGGLPDPPPPPSAQDPASAASSPHPSRPSVGAGGARGGAGWGFHPCSDPSACPPCRPGLSRGPSPVVLGSQDALPVATAFTEYVHAYFKGRDADSCLVKVTGELTMSFPAGIVRVFSGTAAPPVLSFRLLNAGAIEHFLPNTDLLYSDPSQSDPSTKDFWLNMAALTGHLQRQAEQSPAASYYNVALLKYQFSRLGPGSAPLRLCVRWDCAPGATRVSVDYSYNAGALALPVPLANVHVLLPVEEPLTNLRLQPVASWYRGGNQPGGDTALGVTAQDSTGDLEPPQGGKRCGRLSASWEPLGGPSKPSPVAAQFSSEGSTLSGVEVELASAGYRMSLVKKRFATGTAGEG